MKHGQTSIFSVVLALFVTGCCCNFPDLSTFLIPEEAEPSDSTPGADLGLAAYPPTAPEASATKYSWRDRRLDPPVYRARYALGADAQKAVDDAHMALAKRVKFKDQGNGNFRWTPPRGCDVHMQCIFEDLAEESKDEIDPLAARFKARVREAKLDATQAVELVTSYVQAIPYEIPKERPFGLLPPALVAAQKKGDCDSKALLLHMLLDSLGVDSVMLTSDAHRHSMLGVAIPSQGTKVKHDGRWYAFVETTAKNAPIGWISKDLLTPNDWVVVPVQVRGRGSSTSSTTATGKASEEVSGPQPRKKR
ncbi:MAG TPA: hypothetical protein PK156_43235 [Polyangium sp.]|nr:hypothetical protein [Polyangium sp.]